MTSHKVCKICILTRGLKGSDLHTWPEIQEHAADAVRHEEQFMVKHLWDVHGVMVKNDGESEEDCKRRYEVSPP